ncbi:MAG TPA: 30S ribosomal protein S16, partial [Longimicrobium sp.]|nr:30S ribosomal protein S16 [Longimicrobium sp.]
MALKIRLRRMGRKKAPHYRIVVAESAMPRDGRFVAKVGHYNPTTQPATLVVDRDKALQWMAKGAMPTDTVQSLFRKAGVYTDQPTAVAEAATAVTDVARKAGKAVSGAAAAAAGAVASAASAVADAAKDVVETVTDRVSGGADEAAAAPAAEERSDVATAGDVVAEQAEA